MAPVEPNVEMIAHFHVELGLFDENMVGAIRQAMARELRRRLGPEVHVKVTMDFGRPPPPPVPEPAPVPHEPITPTEAFAHTAAFFKRRS